MKKKIIIATISLLIILSIILGFMKKDETKIVKTSKIIKKEILETVEANGYVRVKNSIKLYMPVNVRVSKVNFEKGDIVKKGDILIVFDPEKKNKLKRNIEIIDIEIANLEFKIDDLKKQLDIETLKMDIDIKNNELKSLKESLSIYNLEKSRLNSDKQLQYNNYQVKKKIFDAEGLSINELQEANNLYKESVEKLKKKNLEIYDCENKIIQKTNEITLAKRNLDVKKKKRVNEITTENNNLKKKQLEKASLLEELEKLSDTIISPVDGTIVGLNAEENYLSDPEKELAEIADIDSQIIIAEIPTYDLKDVKLNQSVIVTSDILEKGETYKGIITNISTIAENIESGNVKETVVEVEIKIDEKNMKLKPGYDVDVKIITNRKKESLIISSFSIIEKNGKKYVYLLKMGKAYLTEIKTGLKNITETEVIGLSLDEKVISNPANLKDGENVKESNKKSER